MPFNNRLKIPENVSAEYALVASIISDSNFLYEESVKSEFFYKPELREVVKVILHLFVENKPIDLISIQEQLRIWNKLEEVGGEPFLNTLLAVNYSPTHAKTYLEIIKDAYLLRNIIDLGNACLETGYTPNIKADIAKERISDLSDKFLSEQEISRTFSLSDLVSIEWDDLHFRIENPDKAGIQTGFKEYDLLTGGLRGGDVVIIGARPGQGKSALALKIALNIAKLGKASLIWSLEMSHQQLTQRLSSIESGVNLTKIMAGKMNQDEYSRVTESLKNLNGLPIYVEDDVSATIYDMMTKVRRLHQKNHVQVFILDYIQLLTTDSENQTHEIGVISRSLKKLAMELNITCIGISQLNRNVESRIDKRPVLSDLRQSGDLEQDADKVLFIFREELYERTDSNAGLAELILSKHRNGPVGNFPLIYRGENTDFRNMG